MQRSVRNVCGKFKIDPLSCFCTGARQVFTTQKLFPSEIDDFGYSVAIAENICGGASWTLHPQDSARILLHKWFVFSENSLFINILTL